MSLADRLTISGFVIPMFLILDICNNKMAKIQSVVFISLFFLELYTCQAMIEDFVDDSSDCTRTCYNTYPMHTYETVREIRFSFLV